MNHSRRALPAILAAALLAFAGPALADHIPASSIPATDLVQAADLAAVLAGPQAGRPLVLQVGFRKGYAQAHIPGAEYVGAASEDEGLEALRRRVDPLPRDKAIVIYCGCCPWRKCPNIAAAYQRLQAMGFRAVKALYVAEDFGTDWVDRGYPVEPRS